MQAALRLFNIKVSCECDAGKDDYTVTKAVADSASKFLRTTKTLQPSSITVIRKSYDCRTPPKLRLEQQKRRDSVSGTFLYHVSMRVQWPMVHISSGNEHLLATA